MKKNYLTGMVKIGGYHRIIKDYPLVKLYYNELYILHTRAYAHTNKSSEFFVVDNKIKNLRFHIYISFSCDHG